MVLCSLVYLKALLEEEWDWEDRIDVKNLSFDNLKWMWWQKGWCIACSPAVLLVIVNKGKPFFSWQFFSFHFVEKRQIMRITEGSTFFSWKKANQKTEEDFSCVNLRIKSHVLSFYFQRVFNLTDLYYWSLARNRVFSFISLFSCLFF